MDEVLGIRVTGRGSAKVVMYASMRDAIGFGNSFQLYSCPEHIAQDLRRISSDDMLRAYNAIVPSVRRWKSTDDISTRIEGAIAIWDAAIKRLPIQALTSQSGPEPYNEREDVMAKKTEQVESKGKGKTKEKPKEESNGDGGQRGRSSPFAGQRIYAKVKPDECGRREGSGRYQSFVIIANAGKTGIKFEDYKEKGGDAKVLSWFKDADKIGIK
jgi:hypothetical protein